MKMRLVTWNCRVGGFRDKAALIAKLRPDVLVVQEVEPIDDLLLFAGRDQPTFRDRVADPAYPRRAIGVFSYTNIQLQAVDATDRMYAFRRYEASLCGLEFQVVAVWTAETESRATSYMQAHTGLAYHADWIKLRPTVILGDFNNNGSYRNGKWGVLEDRLRSLGLVSAYHTHFSESFGNESRPTHFFQGKEAAAFHLDYCFLPLAWVPCIRNVEVGTYSDWHHVSDHVPLIVELDIEGAKL